MTEKRKARPTVGAAERAETETTAGSASISTKHHSTNSEEKQATIASLLGIGEGNAVKSADLVRVARLKNVRQLQNLISEERASGTLILSTCRPPFGYFLPSDGEHGRREIEAFISTLHARACNTQIALRTARRVLRECYGQEAIGDEKLN